MLCLWVFKVMVLGSLSILYISVGGWVFKDLIIIGSIFLYYSVYLYG